MKKIIFVEELDGGGMFYQGTFSSLGDAVVYAMGLMLEHKENTFRNEGDYYWLEPMFRMDGDAAYCIIVHYKAECWKKEVTERFIFLEAEDKENGI